MQRHALALVVAVLSVGCGYKPSPDRDLGIASSRSMAMTLPPQEQAMIVSTRGAARSAGAGASTPVDPVSYLAYSYGLSLELPGDRLAGVMDRHTAACRDAGLRVCQLVGSRRDGDPQHTLRGSLSLRAEPQWLQRFTKSVQSDVLGAAGRVTAQATTTDDLTRDIVDTEATLRAKRALRDRLQQLLATRPGSLSDLLGVERELARVQGEIDSTDSNLAAMRTRVAMSALTIEYASSPQGVAGGAFEPLRLAIGEFAVAVVTSTAALVTAVGALLPWAVVLTIAVWLLIRRRRRARALAIAQASTP